MQLKVVYLDIEATGIDIKKGAIVQIAGLIEVNGKVVSKFNLKMKAHSGATIDFNKRLHKKHIKSNEQGFLEFKKVLEKHIDIYNPSDKYFIIAYNSSFDEEYLRTWFLRNNCKYFGSYFFNPSIDVMQVAQWYFMLTDSRHKLDNIKLGTTAKYFNITVEDNKLHEAYYDAFIMRNLYLTLVTKLRKLRWTMPHNL